MAKPNLGETYFQSSQPCPSGAPPRMKMVGQCAILYARQAECRGRFVLGVASPQSSLTQGALRYHQLLLPQGKHARQILFIVWHPSRSSQYKEGAMSCPAKVNLTSR